MKYLRLVLCLSLLAFVTNLSIATADDYDSEKATITKSSDSTAKVLIGSSTYMAPITFADGASWDSVKDHYEVDPSLNDLFAKNMVSISIGSDGGASFTKCAKSCSSSKKK